MDQNGVAMSPYCKNSLFFNLYNLFIIRLIIRSKVLLCAIFKTILQNMELIKEYEETNFIIWHTVFGEFSIQPGVQAGEDR
jgi:hypothetical protein